MSKFISFINKTYKSVLTEQVPNYGEPAGGAGLAAPAMPPVAPVPAAPAAMGGQTPQEQPVETQATRSSSDAFLIGMIAKALLVDLDSDDRLKVIKYLKGLDEDSATNIEENLVNIINSYDYQTLDEDLSDIEIPPKKSRKVLRFIEKIMNEYVDTETKPSKKKKKIKKED